MRKLRKREEQAVSRAAHYDSSRAQAWHWTVRSNIPLETLRLPVASRFSCESLSYPDFETLGCTLYYHRYSLLKTWKTPPPAPWSQTIMALPLLPMATFAYMTSVPSGLMLSARKAG